MQDWVIRLIDWGGYAGVYLLSLLETIILPAPSEVILPMAGMRAANGPLDLPGVVAASTAGSMTGNMIWYMVARAIGLERLKYFVERHGRWLALEWRDVERVRLLFARFSWAIVCAGRMLPAIRTLVSLPAGIVRMPVLSFAFWSTLGTASFAFLLAGAGYAAGAQVDRVERIAGPLSSIVVGSILIWYLWRQLSWNRRLRARRESEAAAAANL